MSKTIGLTQAGHGAQAQIMVASGHGKRGSGASTRLTIVGSSKPFGGDPRRQTETVELGFSRPVSPGRTAILRLEHAL